MTENETLEFLKKANRDNDMVCILPKSDMGKCLIKALEEVQQYRAIGTVEECREAIEKQKSKKPTEQFKLGTSGRGGKCPSCKQYLDRSVDAMYCDCGQKLDWSDEE